MEKKSRASFPYNTSTKSDAICTPQNHSVKMDFESFNKVGALENILQTKKLADLEVKTNHPIHDIRSVQTKFGKRYIAEIGGQYTVFLPARLAKAFDQDENEFKELLGAAHRRELYMETFADKWSKIVFKHDKSSF